MEQKFEIIKSYKTPYTNFIVLNIGDEVILRENEQEGKWEGWIWVEIETQKGWAPIQILEISHNRKKGKVLEFYTSQELNVNKGDYVLPARQLNGWTWVKNIYTEKEGWIPNETITLKNK